MKANELRIGNLLQGKIIVQVDAILRNKQVRVIGSESAFVVEGKNPCILPIPITEEMLLKCGFECYEFDNGEPNQYRFKSRLIVIRNGFFYDYGADVKIEFVHQLQNLYFALTGEELPINLTA